MLARRRRLRSPRADRSRVMSADGVKHGDAEEGVAREHRQRVAEVVSARRDGGDHHEAQRRVETARRKRSSTRTNAAALCEDEAGVREHRAGEPPRSSPSAATRRWTGIRTPAAPARERPVRRDAQVAHGRSLDEVEVRLRGVGRVRRARHVVRVPCRSSTL